MTIEEAHIKAHLLYEEKYGSIFVQITTYPGDDPTPSYEILISGEYDMGDDALGLGSSWEEAFQRAEEDDKHRDAQRREWESKKQQREDARKLQAKQDKLNKRKNKKRI